MSRGVALEQLDAFGFELRTHGRVRVLIRTGNAMTRALGQQGHAPHEGSASAEDVNVHLINQVKQSD
jgi:hypothetical protein